VRKDEMENNGVRGMDLGNICRFKPNIVPSNVLIPISF